MFGVYGYLNLTYKCPEKHLVAVVNLLMPNSVSTRTHLTDRIDVSGSY